MRDKVSSWRADFAELSTVFAPLSILAARFASNEDWPTLDELNALAVESRLDVRFVSQAPKRRRWKRRPDEPSVPYEERVYRLREIPTRPRNWHDFFNALVWILFPHTKAALNERQILGK